MVSDDGSLEVEGSPQNLAAEWLINEDMRYVCPQDPTLIQRYSMAVFYYSTDGNDWFQCNAPSDFGSEEAIAEANANCNLVVEGSNSSDAWLTPSSECDWGGVACTASGFIDRLDFGKQKTNQWILFPMSAIPGVSFSPLNVVLFILLSERNGIGGSLPSEISRFNELRYLLLEEGLISGSIPEDIGFNVNLLQIDLNFNAITGSLPETIYRLTKLEQLDLNDNEFTGTISTNISRLMQLVFLQLEQNSFRGTIPEELGNLFMLGTSVSRKVASDSIILLTYCRQCFLAFRGCHNGKQPTEWFHARPRVCEPIGPSSGIDGRLLGSSRPSIASLRWV